MSARAKKLVRRIQGIAGYGNIKGGHALGAGLGKKPRSAKHTALRKKVAGDIKRVRKEKGGHHLQNWAKKPFK